MSAPEDNPTVAEVLRFEDLPLGSCGSRRAVVRWSDGTESEALSWFDELSGAPDNSWTAQRAPASSTAARSS